MKALIILTAILSLTQVLRAGRANHGIVITANDSGGGNNSNSNNSGSTTNNDGGDSGTYPADANGVRG